MTTAHDVAQYLLTLVCEEEGDLMSNLKLQKLLYYVQGFHLAIYDAPLFQEEIRAWRYGPVVPEVYHKYKACGRNAIPAPTGTNFNKLSDTSHQLIDDVYAQFGQYEASVLMNFTHEEPTWQNVENNDVITHDALKQYFKTQLVNG